MEGSEMKLTSPIPRVFGRAAHGGGPVILPFGRTRCGSCSRHAILQIVGLAVPLLLWSAGVGPAQTVDHNLWVTNGPVNAILNDGGTIYIGGNFTYVGPATGSVVGIDANTGAAQQPYPKVAGAVNVV